MALIMNTELDEVKLVISNRKVIEQRGKGKPKYVQNSSGFYYKIVDGEIENEQQYKLNRKTGDMVPVAN